MTWRADIDQALPCPLTMLTPPPDGMWGSGGWDVSVRLIGCEGQVDGT